MSKTLNNNNIYIIPISVDDDGWIVYAPLHGLMFWANTEAVKIINKHFDNGGVMPVNCEKLTSNLERIIEKPTVPLKTQKLVMSDSAVIILSQKCNLSCTYCYAQESRSSDTITKSKLKTVIDFILSTSNKKKSFSFIGGGEPTVTWELLEWAVEYIREKSMIFSIKTQITLTTNATLLTLERISWLKMNKVNVGVSFEILPEIQNLQRCFPNKSINSFEIVDECIKLLIANWKPPSIRSTITPQNVFLMKDMVAFVSEHYPEIKRLHFEHVTDLQLEQKNYYDSFYSQFFIARTFARENGMELNNSIINSTNRLKSRFCAGEFCITPNGELVSCHRVSSSEEELFDKFFYGNVGEKIIIDDKALENVEYYNNFKPSLCSDCFAQWHCAGACPYKRHLFNPNQLSVYCEFTKKMIAKELEVKLNSQNIKT